MTRNAAPFVLFWVLLGAAVAQTASCASAKVHAIFKASSGEEIVLDTRNGILHVPHSSGAALHDCGNKYETCLTDQNGFAFSFFRNCNNADYKQLRFYPKFVSVLHDNLWIVFDAAPNYMFHYVIPKGIVGIYVGPTPSYDFRGLLHDRNLQLDKLDASEYRIDGSDSVAACSE